MTFRITGSNDAPAVDRARSVVAGAVTERAGRTGSGARDEAAGRIVFDDADRGDRRSPRITGRSIAYADASGRAGS